MKVLYSILFVLFAGACYADSTFAQVPTPMYQLVPQPHTSASDYTLLGLVGTMLVSMLGLLTWMIRSTIEQQVKSTEAMNKLSEVITSSKEASLLLASEIKNAFNNLNQRLDRLEQDIREKV